MKTAYFRIGLLAILALSLANLQSIAAAAVLDQYFEPDLKPNSAIPLIVEYAYVCGDFCQAQTFTAGTSGQLTRIELFLEASGAPSGNLVLDIVPTMNGAPTGDLTNTLAHAIVSVDNLLPLDSSHQWVGFDISPFHLSMTPNESLAIVLRGDFTNTDYGDPHSPTPLNNFVLWLGGGGGIAGQEAYFDMNSADHSWSIIQGYIPVQDGPGITDLESGGPMRYGFRTYVEPVPEPSAFIMLIGAGFPLLFYLKKR